jgi:hypothetical protein
MRTLFLVAIATILLVIAFFALFPEEALGVVGDVGGPYTIGLTMDDRATHIRWIVGVVSFIAALSTYVRAFT